MHLEEDEVQRYFSALKTIADQVVHQAEQDHLSELEPFEQYAQRLRHSIYESFAAYQEEFVKGYEILIKEVEQGNKRDGV